jgi:hypothetical protein
MTRCQGIKVSPSRALNYGDTIQCDCGKHWFRICVAGAPLFSGALVMYAAGSSDIVIPAHGVGIRIAGQATHCSYPNAMVVVQTYGTSLVFDTQSLQAIQALMRPESKPQVDTEIEIQRRHLEKCFQLEGL